MSLSKNTQLALRVLAVVVGMACLAYASFPLYTLFCKVTGYNGTPKQVRVANATIGTRTITVRFNADRDPELPWDFYPVQDQITVKTGQTHLIYFEAINRSSLPVTGMATFNVTPEKAAPYFNKIQCFCFEQQTLQPGQKIRMPVSFFIDPAIEQDVNVQDITTVTLSYTFFVAKE